MTDQPTSGARYIIQLIDGRLAITCLVCRRTSYNPHDVEQKYCGFCHVFHETDHQDEREPMTMARRRDGWVFTDEHGDRWLLHPTGRSDSPFVIEILERASGHRFEANLHAPVSCRVCGEEERFH